MADISNPEITKFLNEQVRPLAEEVRALTVRIDAAIVEWVVLGKAVPDDVVKVDDGRASEGVSQLDAKEVNAFMDLLAALQGVLNASGVQATVARPCVRALEVR